MHASPANVRHLPICRINFPDPADKQKYDAIVTLVNEMLRLQKDHAIAEREKLDQRFTLKQRIEQVDKQIDALVYELYGLTEEEIKTIEA